MNLNAKKLFLIGFVVILLIGIPVTIYLLQQQQTTGTQAQKSTNISFTPDSTQTQPIQKQVGETIPLDIMVDPGANLVSFVKLQIQYDSDKLATTSGSAFTPNTLVFPTVLEGPVYSPGKIEVTLSVGPDPTKAIQSLAKAGTVTFTALADTPAGQPTIVTYGPTTQVLSIGATDQASENVLAASTPATIAIGAAGPSVTEEPVPSGSPTPTLVPTGTPVPTPTSVASLPTPTSAPTPTGTSSGTTTPNQLPVCNNLVVDRATTGVAPFAITFTVNGSDSDGTISNVNFNFGDGGVSGDITTSGGIGSNSVNVSTSHEYQNQGTYTASAILTDNSGDVSGATECQQTIIVQGGSGGGDTNGGDTTNPTFTPTPSLEPTGAVETAMGIGIFALILTIGGALLFFAL